MGQIDRYKLHVRILGKLLRLGYRRWGDPRRTRGCRLFRRTRRLCGGVLRTRDNARTGSARTDADLGHPRGAAEDQHHVINRPTLRVQDSGTERVQTDLSTALPALHWHDLVLVNEIVTSGVVRELRYVEHELRSPTKVAGPAVQVGLDRFGHHVAARLDGVLYQRGAVVLAHVTAVEPGRRVTADLREWHTPQLKQFVAVIRKQLDNL